MAATSAAAFPVKCVSTWRILKFVAPFSEPRNDNLAHVTPAHPIEGRPLPLLGEAALRDFIGAGSVTRLEAVGRPGGFDLRVHMGATEATLGNTRGGVRLFASLEALTALLKRLEQPRFEVDATNYVTGSLRPPRRTRPSNAVAALEKSEATKKPRPLR